jgi:hypothetical protein
MDLMWFYISGYILLLLVIGYLIPFIREKRIARLFAWVIAVVTVLAATLFTSDQAPLVRMLIIVFLQLLSMKIVVAVESYSGENRLKAFQWIAFALGWFGMRPALFEKLPSRSLPFVQLVIKGVSRIVIGFLLLYQSTVLEQYTGLARFFLPQLFLLVGLSLILHFGILNLSTAVWRAFGVNASELFRSPYRSTSLKEFWGKRWNIAFSEMTALVAYRPLRTKIGVENAMIVSFLLSGLLHEIAISLPVRAGYGLPMIYFGIHAVAMQLEAKSPVIQKIVRHKFLSHVWVMTLLVLPMPLLFHPAFMQHVLIPLRTLLCVDLSY